MDVCTRIEHSVAVTKKLVYDNIFGAESVDGDGGDGGDKGLREGWRENEYVVRG